MGLRILLGAIVQLALGAILGAIVGGVVTGDDAYGVVIGVGVPVLVIVAGVTATLRVRLDKTRLALAATPQQPQPPQQAVLNPVSVAQPSPGVVLNGQIVGGTKAEPTPRPAVHGSGAEHGRAGWRLLAIVTVLAGAALALIPSYPIIAWIASDVAAGRPFDGRDMRTGLHQQEAFDQLAEVIGSTEVTDISFYDSYIIVSAPTSPGAATVDEYMWRYGRAFREGPDIIQPQDLSVELFDAGDIDMSLIPALVRRSIDDADLGDLDGIYPSIQRFAGAEPEISISLSNAYYDAYYDYTLTGELIQRSGSAFE